MTSRELRRTQIRCWALVLLIGAADLALFLWIDGPARLMLHDNDARYWPIVLVLGALCFPLSAAILAQSWVDARRARASAGWPVATGEVLASGIETFVGRSGRRYRPRVRYKYV